MSDPLGSGADPDCGACDHPLTDHPLRGLCTDHRPIPGTTLTGRCRCRMFELPRRTIRHAPGTTDKGNRIADTVRARLAATGWPITDGIADPRILEAYATLVPVGEKPETTAKLNRSRMIAARLNVASEGPDARRQETTA